MDQFRVILTALLCSLTGAASSFALGGSIGIFADQDALRCSENLPGLGTPLTLYVYAQLFDASQDGIRGAEYGITTSASTDWLFAEDFSPVTDTGGIVLGTGAMTGGVPGVNIAWGQCQQGSGGLPGPMVLLQTVNVVDVTGTFAGQVNRLRVESHASPGNPFFRCPLFTLCDDPVFTKVCVGWQESLETCPFPPGALACRTSVGGEFLINDIVCDGQCLCVQVDERSWGSVKQLYR